jgi:fucose 4-O-acetylase-like acetyltransferase
MWLANLRDSSNTLEGHHLIGRIVWIDATKGYAITLVVFGHVLGGMMARGWLSGAYGDAPRLIYDYIYSFHMPLFLHHFWCPWNQ